MDFEIAGGEYHPSFDSNPKHKITVTDGSDTFIYWYVNEGETGRNFDLKKDRKLVEIIHTKGKELTVGHSITFIFPMETNHNYDLKRLAPHEFVVKSLG